MLETQLRDFSMKGSSRKSTVEDWVFGERAYKKYINEFWTAKQRDASSLHEISYRACFKPQLPRFFIQLLSQPSEVIYDPFAGRGTTALEAALNSRVFISNDVNPISNIFIKGRLDIPSLDQVERRLREIKFKEHKAAEIDLSMFFHKKNISELVSLKDYFASRHESGELDSVDQWIQMVATNRLTGHSKGFFSVYTLPPNQAVTPDRQRLINKKLGQKPVEKDLKALILKKSKSLLRNLNQSDIDNIKNSAQNSLILNEDARFTSSIEDQSVDLVITSPPFLKVVQYWNDNWLRCWFNSISAEETEKKITIPSKLSHWVEVMSDVMVELSRVLKPKGWIAFEVGEIHKGRVKLEESIVPIGEKAKLSCKAILINQQKFTKTSNIWGVSNMTSGTNSNRIVLFQKS
jgi:DNA modification methylase